MSKKSDTNQAKTEQNYEKNISELEQRLQRLEKRCKSNERLAKTLASCLDTQLVANEAVTKVVRRAIRDDVEVHDELSLALAQYDRTKFHRCFSGVLGVFFRIVALAAASFVGAFIYWAFSGQ